MRIKNKVNYVIATFGDVRGSSSADPEINREYLKDYSYYLREHLKQLDKLKHNLSQITIVVNKLEYESESFIDYIDEISTSRKYKVLRRPSNEGISYGAYSYAYDTCGDDFDYYFFIEDDYIPVMNNFDKIFIKCFKEIENCGFLVAGGAECGISSSKVLHIIKDKYGVLPYSEPDSRSQVTFSSAFSEVGFKRECILKYKDFNISAGYWQHPSKAVWIYGDGPPILVPIQYLNPDIPRINVGKDY